MADLFDMNMSLSGVNMFIPVAMVAVAALFIACFAISGYIDFRNSSIPSAALEEHLTTSGKVTADSFQHSGSDASLEHVRIFTNAGFGGQQTNAISALVTTAGGTSRYSLPANAVVKHMVVTATTALTPNNTTLDIGTADADDTASDNFGVAVPITALNAINKRVSLGPKEAGASAFPTAGFITVKVNTATLQSGALAVDVYYYQF